MTATVYASKRGRRYHADENCRALHTGQDLYGGWGTLATHRIDETNPITALGQGKDPCTICIPGLLTAIYRSGCEDDFGHEPVTEDREFFGERPDDIPVCARCTRTIRAFLPVVIGQEIDGRVISREEWTTFEVAVLWPCTSALVLGLVPRTTP